MVLAKGNPYLNKHKNLFNRYKKAINNLTLLMAFNINKGLK